MSKEKAMSQLNLISETVSLATFWDSKGWLVDEQPGTLRSRKARSLDWVIGVWSMKAHGDGGAIVRGPTS